MARFVERLIAVKLVVCLCFLVAKQAKLVVATGISKRTFSLPMFRGYDHDVVMQYANAFKKVAENYKELLADDPGDPEMLGGWHRIDHKKKVGDK